ncbi:6-phosphogluconolactonase [Thalassotalea aquiviva]|uniref:6-phosphogluconolactonase n=1 Tax=Thalassotalea aquiviva TaxID=3242415 RepID=UPI00352B1284
MNKLNTFTSKAELDQALAEKIAQQLQDAIEQKGHASIAFSGGSTPKGLFDALSNIDLDWHKVTVTLADDRWVDEQHDSSNAKLIKENLLVNHAHAARFFALKQGQDLTKEQLAELTEQAHQHVLPLDVTILGMGEDGHTASIFPCSAQVDEGLDVDATPALIKVVPTTAPFERISFNFTALIQSNHLYLHIVGDSKQQVLEQALSSDDAREMPIRAFLQHPTKLCEIYWTH